ncbi:MAG: hypothetical protein HPY85_09550 [Anaerolineae bacterium]|jgi:flavodoxin|nr:hypothetical protein [Anaerolineae bacterium]
MKTQIVYFSLQGHTKLVAEFLAEKLSASLTRLVDRKNLDGNAIAQHEYCDLADDPWQVIPGSDRLIVLAPVWGFSIIPAMYTFLEKADLAGKEVVIGVTSAFGKLSARPVLKRYTEIVINAGGKVAGTFNVKSNIQSTPDPQKMHARTAAVLPKIQAF